MQKDGLHYPAREHVFTWAAGCAPNMHFANMSPDNRIPFRTGQRMSDAEIFDQMRPYVNERLLVVFGPGISVPIYDHSELAVVARMVSRYNNQDDGGEVLHDPFFSTSAWNYNLFEKVPECTDVLPCDCDQTGATLENTHKGSSRSNPIFIPA